MIHVDPNSFAGKLIIVLGLPLFVWMLFTLGKDIRKAHASRSWPTTPGVVLSSEIERSSGQHGPTYKPRVQYSYHIGRAELSGDRISFRMAPLFFTRRYAEELVARYPPTNPITVYYHPDDGTVTVLEPGDLDWSHYFLGSVCIFGIYAGTRQLLTRLTLLYQRLKTKRLVSPYP